MSPDTPSLHVEILLKKRVTSSKATPTLGFMVPKEDKTSTAEVPRDGCKTRRPAMEQTKNEISTRKVWQINMHDDQDLSLE